MAYRKAATRRRSRNVSRRPARSFTRRRASTRRTTRRARQQTVRIEVVQAPANQVARPFDLAKGILMQGPQAPKKAAF